MAVNKGVLRGVGRRAWERGLFQGSLRIKTRTNNATSPRYVASGNGLTYVQEPSGVWIQAMEDTSAWTSSIESPAIQLLNITDFQGIPIFCVLNAGGIFTFGDYSNTGNGVFGPFSGFDGSLGNNVSPVPAFFQTNLGGLRSQYARLYFGYGTPSATTLPSVTANVGDMFFNQNAQGGVALYQCVGAGSPGTWVSCVQQSLNEYGMSFQPFGVQTFSSVPRQQLSTATMAGPGTGKLLMSAVVIPAGTLLTNLGFMTGTTAAVTPTAQWLGLFDFNRNLLARTADQTTTAIAANSVYSPAIAQVAGGAASSYTTTSTGLYYVGLSVSATTMPTLCGYGGIAQANGNVLTPILCGASSTQATPPGFPFTAAAINPQADNPYLYAVV